MIIVVEGLIIVARFLRHSIADSQQLRSKALEVLHVDHGVLVFFFRSETNERKTFALAVLFVDNCMIET